MRNSVFVGVLVGLVGCDRDDASASASASPSASASISASASALASAPPQPDVPAGMVAIAGGALKPCALIGTSRLPDECIERAAVTVKPFFIDQTEVTVDDYAACAKAGACTDQHLDGLFCNWTKRADKGRHAMNCVSYLQAAAFCAWKGKRLPSGNEWELAARGPDRRLFPWGNQPLPPETLPASSHHDMHESMRRALGMGLCWRSEGTCEVDSKRTNDYGVADLWGNVAEWTSARPQDDARLLRHVAPEQHQRNWRLLYGSSWKDPDVDDTALLGIAFAQPTIAEAHGKPVAGIRCASDAR